jgi:hypothetical protein
MKFYITELYTPATECTVASTGWSVYHFAFSARQKYSFTIHGFGIMCRWVMSFIPGKQAPHQLDSMLLGAKNWTLTPRPLHWLCYPSSITPSSIVTASSCVSGRGQTCKSTDEAQDECPEHKACVPHVFITDKHHAQEQKDDGITCWAGTATATATLSYSPHS